MTILRLQEQVLLKQDDCAIGIKTVPVCLRINYIFLPRVEARKCSCLEAILSAMRQSLVSAGHKIFNSSKYLIQVKVANQNFPCKTTS